jgi:hypothetical protein
MGILSNLFGGNQKKKLGKKYDKLMKESFDLSKVNRKKADEKYAEAQQVMYKLEKLS